MMVVVAGRLDRLDGEEAHVLSDGDGDSVWAACEIERLGGRALLALQGPEAGAVLEAMAPESAEMRFMDVRALTLAGAECIVSRSGYSGEDGFEISVPDDAAV
ncbi:MAG: hypothetical protein IIB85_03695, partial [Chloroflexi bacterium]|nr:hypothetical protein [Chloroflexota bacterium]